MSNTAAAIGERLHAELEHSLRSTGRLGPEGLMKGGVTDQLIAVFAQELGRMQDQISGLTKQLAEKGLSPTGRYTQVDWREIPWLAEKDVVSSSVLDTAALGKVILNYASDLPIEDRAFVKGFNNKLQEQAAVAMKTARAALGSTWSPDLVELPKEAPATPAHSRTGTTAAGPQTAALRMCAKSEWHGFHPSNEPCPYCAPPKAEITCKVLDTEDWWVAVHSGHLYDLNRWPAHKKNPDFIPLASVKPHTVEAKRMCGCAAGGPCSYYATPYNRGIRVRDAVHEWPQVVKQPGFSRDP